MPAKNITKPPLSIDLLIAGGFNLSGRWEVTEENRLLLSTVAIEDNVVPSLPTERGVYAFAKDKQVFYVGLATMGIAKRLGLYAKPHSTQTTNTRLNNIIRTEVSNGSILEIYTACPPNFEWNGIPISGDTGLERGLIDAYHLPWNIRGL